MQEWCVSVPSLNLRERVCERECVRESVWERVCVSEKDTLYVCLRKWDRKRERWKILFVSQRDIMYEYVCLKVRKRESERGKRERRESVCLRKILCVCVCLRKWEREKRESVCVSLRDSVYVFESEKEGERERLERFDRPSVMMTGHFESIYFLDKIK